MAAKTGPYLIQRGSGYAFRIAIPVSLRGHFLSSAGKPLTHITEGLGTDSPTQAKEKRDTVLAKWRLEFQRAKDGSALLPAEIETEAHLAYQRELDAMADAAKRGAHKGPGVEGPNGEVITPEATALSAAHEQYCEASEDPDFSFDMGGESEARHCPVAATIRDIERRRGITIDPATGTYAALAKALLSAGIAAIEGRMRLLDGRPSEEPASFTGARGIDPKTLQPLAPMRGRPIIRSDGGLRFSEAAALYLAERQRDKKAALRAQTVEGRRQIYRLFQDFIDDAPLKDITRARANEFLTTMAHDRGISNATSNFYAVAMSRVFKWAIKAGRFDKLNPFAEQFLPEAKGTGYVSFNDDELTKLLGSFEQPFNDPVAWATVIALYSGLRINEIAQLEAEDIRQEFGIWFFDICEGNGKLLKTEAAARRVPIHSKLQGYGFVEYAQRKEGPLWPKLARGNPDKKPGKRLSQRFGEHRRKLGITRERVTFHSLRKNFTSALDRAGVALADAQAILGHNRGFSWNVYSSGPGLTRLRDVVERAQYPGLRLE